MKVIAILAAAGSGSRFSKASKNKTPKQFTNISGKPVILHSLIALQKSKLISQIIVASNREYFDIIHSYVEKFKLTKLILLVEGGKTRFQSVKNAFMQISAKDNDLILIHDAARPNVNVKLLDNMIRFATDNGNTVIGIPISDTIKQVKKGKIKKTFDRTALYTVQTPQIFIYKDLKNSYQKNIQIKDLTDESALLELAGKKVNIFPGNKKNIKLTTLEDLQLLGKFLH